MFCLIRQSNQLLKYLFCLYMILIKYMHSTDIVLLQYYHIIKTVFYMLSIWPALSLPPPKKNPPRWEREDITSPTIHYVIAKNVNIGERMLKLKRVIKVYVYDPRIRFRALVKRVHKMGIHANKKWSCHHLFRF